MNKFQIDTIQGNIIIIRAPQTTKPFRTGDPLLPYNMHSPACPSGFEKPDPANPWPKSKEVLAALSYSIRINRKFYSGVHSNPRQLFAGNFTVTFKLGRLFK